MLSIPPRLAAVIALLCSLATHTASAQSQPPLILAYGSAIFSPFAIIGSGVAGAIDQSQDDPTGWKKTPGGYGERVASRFGQFSVQTTVVFTGSALFHVDPSYHPCRCTNIFARTGHALFSPFIVTTRDGSTAFSPLQPMGAFAGSYASMAWRPQPYDRVKAYQYGLVSLAASAQIALIHEFLHIKL